MPSGRTHDRITLWTLPLVGSLTLATTRSSALTLILCAGFLWGGLMLGPDLDIHSVHYKRWGWFRWIWIPYRGSLHHRSPLSHAPITGTALRILYLSFWLGLVSIAILAIANQVGQFGWTWGEMVGGMGRSLQEYFREWLIFCLGLEMGALSHYGADWAVSTRKRIQKQGWKALKPPPIWVNQRKATTSRKARRVSQPQSTKQTSRGGIARNRSSQDE